MGRIRGVVAHFSLGYQPTHTGWFFKHARAIVTLKFCIHWNSDFWNFYMHSKTIIRIIEILCTTQGCSCDNTSFSKCKSMNARAMHLNLKWIFHTLHKIVYKVPNILSFDLDWKENNSQKIINGYSRQQVTSFTHLFHKQWGGNWKRNYNNWCQGLVRGLDLYYAM